VRACSIARRAGETGGCWRGKNKQGRDGRNDYDGKNCKNADDDKGSVKPDRPNLIRTHQWVRDEGGFSARFRRARILPGKDVIGFGERTHCCSFPFTIPRREGVMQRRRGVTW